MGKAPQGIKIAIVVLAVLIVLTAAALIWLLLKDGNNSTVVVPDNLIGDKSEAANESAYIKLPKLFPLSVGGGSGEQGGNGGNNSSNGGDNGNGTAPQPTANVITLYQSKPEDNRPFKALGMLPGDSVTQYYCVKVTHSENVAVFFGTEITAQTKALANVLNITVTHLDTGKVLYTGPLSGISNDGYGEPFNANNKKETVAYYKIDVSLPTSAGNEYQDAMLECDFTWFVKDAESLDQPVLGDNGSIYLFAALAVFSAALLILLIFARRKYKEEAEI